MGRKPEVGNVQVYPDRPLRPSDKSGYVLQFFCPIQGRSDSEKLRNKGLPGKRRRSFVNTASGCSMASMLPRAVRSPRRKSWL